MSNGLIVILVVLAAILIWVVATVNRFVRLRQHLKESWADIDVELKRRYDLIPNLVETVKGYASHEREVLERIVELRNRAVASQGSSASQAEDESQLLVGLKQIFALAEGYPDLKADRNFLELQRQKEIAEEQRQEAETQRLLRMEDEIHQSVVGQNQAIDAIARAIRRSRAGLKDPRRPIGTFVFCGPTGVGKTELARALANSGALQEAAYPRSRRIDQGACANRMLITSAVAHIDLPTIGLAPRTSAAIPGEDSRTALGGIDRVQDYKPRILHPAVRVNEPAGKAAS